MECFADNVCITSLLRDINDECDNMMHSGMESAGIIINKNDIETIARDPRNRRHVTALTLKAGTRAYRIINKRNNPFTGTNKSLEVGDFRNTWTKTAAFFIPTDGWETGADILDPLANNRFVVVLVHDWEHTNSDNVVDNKYEIFGLENGLKVSSLTQTLYENNDVYSVEMQETGATLSGVYFQQMTFNQSTLTPQSFTGDMSTGMWINPYTSEQVAPSAFTREADDTYTIVFGHGGAVYRWQSMPNANIDDFSTPLQGSKVEEGTDNTCEALSALLVSE